MQPKTKHRCLTVLRRMKHMLQTRRPPYYVGHPARGLCVTLYHCTGSDALTYEREGRIILSLMRSYIQPQKPWYRRGSAYWWPIEDTESRLWAVALLRIAVRENWPLLWPDGTEKRRP